ncbi:MAG: hypothetical protein U5L96_07780 [Owenweeksia sp.]|nr:hypothetical protein [Owenweeksia sp.]
MQNIPWFHHFTKNELSWYGKPKSEEVRQFVKPHYGVYISFNTKPGSPLQFVNAGIDADFSIGLQHPSFTRFDLVVGQSDGASLQDVFKEMEYYLNFINQKT